MIDKFIKIMQSKLYNIQYSEDIQILANFLNKRDINLFFKSPVFIFPEWLLTNEDSLQEIINDFIIAAKNNYKYIYFDDDNYGEKCIVLFGVKAESLARNGYSSNDIKNIKKMKAFW